MRIGKIFPKFLLFTLALFFAVSLLIKVTKVQNYFGIKRAGTEVKVVALTYDDGPSPPSTNLLLDILDRYQVKATFFEIGRNIEKHPEIVPMIVARGHELANYSYYSDPCRSRKFFTPPQPSPYKGEGVRNSQMI